MSDKIYLVPKTLEEQKSYAPKKDSSVSDKEMGAIQDAKHIHKWRLTLKGAICISQECGAYLNKSEIEERLNISPPPTNKKIEAIQEYWSDRTFAGSGRKVLCDIQSLLRALDDANEKLTLVADTGDITPHNDTERQETYTRLKKRIKTLTRTLEKANDARNQTILENLQLKARVERKEQNQIQLGAKADTLNKTLDFLKTCCMCPGCLSDLGY